MAIAVTATARHARSAATVGASVLSWKFAELFMLHQRCFADILPLTLTLSRGERELLCSLSFQESKGRGEVMHSSVNF